MTTTLLTRPATTTTAATMTTATMTAATMTTPLTSTEHKVADLIAMGMSNKQIASELFVSVRTVESHVSHVLVKIGAHSRVQIALACLAGNL
jgi:DNA-binding NarL/FixJ family response regulator